MRACNSLLLGRASDNFDPQLVGQFSRGEVGFGSHACPYTGPTNWADQHESLQLKTGLLPRAQDGGNRCVFAGEVLGGHRAGSGRAQIGQVPVIQQQRLNQTRRAGQQNHQAVCARQADLGITEETRTDLDGRVRFGTYAVLTSTSPRCSGISSRRMGGMTTFPVARVRNASSTQRTMSRSSFTKLLS